jgi:hypothetical protein
MNSGEAVGSYIGIKFCFHSFGDTVLPYLICNAEGPCQETNNILEIYSVAVLGIHRMYSC